MPSKNQVSNPADIKKIFGYNDAGFLMKRLALKKTNAQERGIEFDLNFDDLIMLGQKLLGAGACDYTGITFSGSGTDTFAPSIERINDKVGYVRGNIAIVCNRANHLKDMFKDKVASRYPDANLNRDDIRILNNMIPLLTDNYLFELKKKYIPVFSSEEDLSLMCKGNYIHDKITEMDKSLPKEVLLKGTTDALYVQACEDQQQVEQEAPPVEVEPTPEPVPIFEMPVDVEVAASYSSLCRGLQKLGIEVVLTFAQYKDIYMNKRCPFTGETLDGARYPVILDRKRPVEKGNLKMTSQSVGEAMTLLLDATGSSAFDLSHNLKKNIAKEPV